MKVPEPAPKRVQFATGSCLLPLDTAKTRQEAEATKLNVFEKLILKRPFTKQESS